MTNPLYALVSRRLGRPRTHAFNLLVPSINDAFFFATSTLRTIVFMQRVVHHCIEVQHELAVHDDGLFSIFLFSFIKQRRMFRGRAFMLLFHPSSLKMDPKRLKFTKETAIEKAKDAAQVLDEAELKFLPMEIQTVIWLPILKEMLVLDAMSIAKYQWGVEALLRDDSLWRYWWKRDFPHLYAITEDMIPPFIMHDITSFPSNVMPEDKIYVNMPWRRYYMWTMVIMRAGIRMVAAIMNKDVQAWVLRHMAGTIDLSGGFARRGAPNYLPIGVNVVTKTYTVDRMSANIIVVTPSNDTAPLGMYISNFIRDTHWFNRNNMEGWTDTDYDDLPPLVWIAKFLCDRSDPENTDLWAGPEETVAPMVAKMTDAQRYAMIVYTEWVLRLLPERGNLIVLGTITHDDMTIGQDLQLCHQKYVDLLHVTKEVLLPIVLRRTYTTISYDAKTNTYTTGRKDTIDIGCVMCGKDDPRKTCSICKKPRYCSRGCQLKHWDAEHHEECEKG
jgi:hypothetical protein